MENKEQKAQLDQLSAELKTKLAFEQEARRQKMEILQAMDTKRLIEMIPKLEKDYEAARREENNFTHLNSRFLTSRTGESSEVKRLKAEALLTMPGKNKEEREAQVDRQRSGETELAQALQMETDLNYTAENLAINTERAKIALNNVLAVLALRKAQIEFLAK